MKPVELVDMCFVHFQDSAPYNRVGKTTALYTRSFVSVRIPEMSQTLSLSLPNAELALLNLEATSSSILAFVETTLPRLYQMYDLG